MLHNQTMKELRLKSRGSGRLPMQWAPGKFADFSSGATNPWTDVNEDHDKWNAASQVSDPSSIFNYWANILKLRKVWVDVFVYGSFELIAEGHDELFVYTRTFGETKAVVITNSSENMGCSR